jgi:phosphoenolpyruvate carboxykinase (GTP)
VTEKAPATDTPIGAVPTVDAIDTDGIDVTSGDMEELLSVDMDDWRAEVPLIREYYAKFGDRLPPALAEQVDTLEKRLG